MSKDYVDIKITRKEQDRLNKIAYKMRCKIATEIIDKILVDLGTEDHEKSSALLLTKDLIQKTKRP